MINPFENHNTNEIIDNVSDEINQFNVSGLIFVTSSMIQTNNTYT